MYQTGFDEPLLQAMYVDKRLDGVQAVQTLSRLNRKIPGKDSPFILDVVNKTEDIYRAFKPYYNATGLRGGSDPRWPEGLKIELDEAQVYFLSEVEAFALLRFDLLMIIKFKQGRESIILQEKWLFRVGKIL
ncbi:MAG: type I restriction enzyme subunit R domain-containing protein [Syntrophobacteraceae bacterium]